MYNKTTTKDQQSNKDIILYRICMFTFPGVCGACRHTVELAHKLDKYINKQIVLTPEYDISLISQDLSCQNLNIVRPLKIDNNTVKRQIFVLQKYLFCKACIDYIINDSKPGDKAIIEIHDWTLGLRFLLLWKLSKKRTDINIPITIMVHGYYPYSLRAIKDNPIRFPRNVVDTILSFFLHPDSYVLLNDGSNILRIKERTRHETDCVLINHAIDTNLFKRLSISPHDDFVILYPHNPSKPKNPEFAFLMLRHLLDIRYHDKTDATRDIKLVILQDNGFDSLLDDLNIRDNVVFAGKQTRDDMIKQYNTCDVVIGTSLQSNMGRAIQEAMSCEVPVVTFNNGHMEQLINNGYDGYLVNPGDVETMARIIYDLYCSKEKLQFIGKNARSKIINERSWDNRIMQEMKNIHSLIDS